MKERGIICKDDEVRAILDGRKTVTRRIVKMPRWVSDFFRAPTAFRAIGCGCGRPSRPTFRGARNRAAIRTAPTTSTRWATGLRTR